MATIYSLPPELLTEILAVLGSMSFKDLCEAKATCRMFYRAADDNVVYRRVTLTQFPRVPWRPRWSLRALLGRCRASDNPEALFREGMINYWEGYALVREGLEAIERAARYGHGEALYALSIIMIFGGDEKERGMENISLMRRAEGGDRRLKEYRWNLAVMLRSIWIKNPIILRERQICCAMQDHRECRNGWDNEDMFLSCDACFCDRDVEFVYELFPRWVVD